MIDDDLDRMLNNWALWKGGAGRGVMGYAATSYDLEARGRRAEVTMPVIDGEALDVDRVVAALDFGPRQALYARYVGELIGEPAGRTIVPVALSAREGQDFFRSRRIPASYSNEQIARWIGVSRSTYERRLDQARRLVCHGYLELRRRGA